MRSLQVSEYRKHLSRYNRSVVEDHDPLIIQVPGQDDVVVIARRDIENLQETVYVLKDKTTMASLLESRLEVAERGNSASYRGMDEVFTDAMED